MSQEHDDYADPGPPGRQVPTNTGWRPPTTAAIVCVVLIPLLAVLGAGVADAHRTSGAWPVILPCGLTFAVGLGCAGAAVG